MSPLGAVIGIVDDNADPDRLGRVRVRCPSLGNLVTDWVRFAGPAAGRDRGLFFMPEAQEEVLVVFLNGDVRFPFVIGALWNTGAPAPVDTSDGSNAIRMIKSRSGHAVIFDDEAQTFTLVDGSGKNSIVFETDTNTVRIVAEQAIELKAPKGKITLDAKTIEIKSSGAAKLGAQGELTLSGSTVDIN